MKPNEKLVEDVLKSCRKATNKGLPIEQVGFTLLQGAMAILLTCETREVAAGLMFSLGQEVKEGRFPDYPDIPSQN